MNAKGFTLLEVMIVSGLVAILLAIAYPSISQWQKTAQFKGAARDLAGAMNEARGRAIARNLEQEIVFNLDTDTFRLDEHRPDAIPPAPPVVTVYTERSFTPAIDLKAEHDGAEVSTGNRSFQFFPNGTFKLNGSSDNGNNNYIWIVDSLAGEMKFRVGVPSTTTGRVDLTNKP